MKLPPAKRKSSSQLCLPLLGGGATNPGYSTVMYGYEPRPKERAVPLQTTPRRELGERRRQWMLTLLRQGPTAWPKERRSKVPDDCLALGWTEWAKDSRGRFMYDMNAKPTPRVRERLTAAGRAALGLPRNDDDKAECNQ